MYKENKSFKKPDDVNIKIYRYLDLSKFISLLVRRDLFFPSANNLSKSDPYEGSLPKDFPKTNDTYKIWNEEIKKNICINCWHINDGESDAMWKLYSKNNDGVAIQSTFKLLVDSLNETTNEIYIGKIEYDYDSWRVISNEFERFLHKRESFEHENELRAITVRNGLVNLGVEVSKKDYYEKLKNDFIGKLSDLINYILSSDKTEKGIEEKAKLIKELTTNLFHVNGIQSSNIEELLRILIQSKIESNEDGIYIKVRPNILIEEIYISPNAKPWILEVVKSINEKYELNKKIRSSILSQKPKIL